MVPYAEQVWLIYLLDHGRVTEANATATRVRSPKEPLAKGSEIEYLVA